MNPETVFVALCPVCESQSTRSVRYLGLKVRCRKCSRIFPAADLHADSASADDPVGIWLKYSSSFECRETPRHPSPR